MVLRGIAGLLVWLAASLAASVVVAEEGRVTGVATYDERVALPPGAVFEAVLEEVSHTGAAVTVGRAATSDPGTPPYSFAIDYDPAAIDPQHTYVVRARVTVGGQLRFASDAARAVIGPGAPAAVEIVMAMVPPSRSLGAAAPATVAVAGGADAAGAPRLRGLVSYAADAARFIDCLTGESYPIAMEADYEALEHAYLAAGQEPGAPLMASFEGTIVERPRMDGGGTGPAVLVERFVGVWPGEECEPAMTEASLVHTYWRIERLGDLALSTGPGLREPHLVLRPSDMRFMATVGCNQLVGSFELAGQQLRFGNAAATRMACPPPLDVWERRLGWTLSETTRWRIDGQALELQDAEGATIASFRAVYLP